MTISGNRNNEGAGRPLPEGGAARYAVLLATNFWKLVGLNLLFVTFSLPVITMPAALCALNRVCMLIIRNGYCFLWQDFVEEFKRSFRRSLLPALLFVFLIFFGYYAMSLGLTNAGLLLWSTIFWTIGIMATVAGICWGAYFYALVSLLDQNNRGILKNARLLCMIRPGRALAVFGIIVAVTFAMAILVPISIALMLFCVFALTQYSVCFLVYEMAADYILEPYEDQKRYPLFSGGVSDRGTGVSLVDEKW